jgi:hypothetical protein
VAVSGAHEQELRRLALRIALDLAILNRHDALAILEMASALTSHFTFPIAGRNEDVMRELETLAVCQGRSS